MDKREIEEVLELIWTLREEGVSQRNTIIEKSTEKKPEQILGQMLKQNLISAGDQEILLTAPGEQYARVIVRRHRLAERLFKDVFKMDEEALEIEACTWEHMLSEDVTDSVCSFLGHPRVCPHNKPIPPGECCKKYKKEKQMAPLVQPLSSIDVGRRVKIVYILPSFKKRLERLTNLGIFAGAILQIRQRYPALVVNCNETTIALDKEVGAEIYVHLTNGS